MHDRRQGPGPIPSPGWQASLFLGCRESAQDDHDALKIFPSGFSFPLRPCVGKSPFLSHHSVVRCTFSSSSPSPLSPVWVGVPGQPFRPRPSLCPWVIPPLAPPSLLLGGPLSPSPPPGASPSLSFRIEFFEAEEGPCPCLLEILPCAVGQ